VKLAKSNLNSIREKRSEGKLVLEHFSDGSIWFVGAIYSVPSDKTAECSQLISQFFTDGHNLRPKQNDEAVQSVFHNLISNKTGFLKLLDLRVGITSSGHIKSSRIGPENRRLKIALFIGFVRVSSRFVKLGLTMQWHLPPVLVQLHLRL